MLSQPPRDERGEVIPHDHHEINNVDGLIRRISAHFIVADPKHPGGRKISTMAMRPSSDEDGGVSIDLQNEVELAGLNARAYVTTPEWMGSVCFTAGQVRNEGFKVGYDPLRSNPHHGQFWGLFPKAKQKALLRAAQWFVEVQGVSLHL